jgi:hypothetical protein
MITTKILTASHVDSVLRLDLYYALLQSIKESTVSPTTMLLSYSCEDGLRYDEDKIRSILHPIPIIITFSEKRLLQFQHFERLLPYIEDSDILAFCDDDDLIHPDKICDMVTHFTDFPNSVFKHAAIVFPSETKLVLNTEDICVCSPTYKVNEYWLYCITGKVFKSFFHPSTVITKECDIELFYSDMLDQYGGNMDMVFSGYICIKYEDILQTTDKVLYYHRKHLFSHIYNKRDYGMLNVIVN